MSPKEQKQSDETNIAVMASNITDIKDDVKDIRHKLENSYVTKEVFIPIQRLVYGLLLAVVADVVARAIGKF